MALRWTMGTLEVAVMDVVTRPREGMVRVPRRRVRKGVLG